MAGRGPGPAPMWLEGHPRASRCPAVRTGEESSPPGSSSRAQELRSRAGLRRLCRRPRLLAQLLGGFAGLALLLAAVGTYGVLSYMVAERRREIGIRMALGADQSRILTEVMKQGLAPAAIGVIGGSLVRSH